jgi:dsRNA-specific ribonuclease
MRSVKLTAISLDLQNQQKDHLLSWVETQIGDSSAAQWNVSCKSRITPTFQQSQIYSCLTVEGQVMGTATAAHKNVARDAAATQALIKLGVKF